IFVPPYFFLKARIAASSPAAIKNIHCSIRLSPSATSSVVLSSSLMSSSCCVWYKYIKKYWKKIWAVLGSFGQGFFACYGAGKNRVLIAVRRRAFFVKSFFGILIDFILLIAKTPRL